MGLLLVESVRAFRLKLYLVQKASHLRERRVHVCPRVAAHSAAVPLAVLPSRHHHPLRQVVGTIHEIQYKSRYLDIQGVAKRLVNFVSLYLIHF